MTFLNRHLWVVLIILALPTISFADQFMVTRVNDGDTITVVTKGKVTIVRLVGIDAPELSNITHLPGQPFSLKAKEYLATLVLNKAVTIKSYGMDRYGRSLSEVFVSDRNVNIEMLKAGLAEVYRVSHPKVWNWTFTGMLKEMQRIKQSEYGNCGISIFPRRNGERCTDYQNKR